MAALCRGGLFELHASICPQVILLTFVDHYGSLQGLLHIVRFGVTAKCGRPSAVQTRGR